MPSTMESFSAGVSCRSNRYAARPIEAVSMVCPRAQTAASTKTSSRHLMYVSFETLITRILANKTAVALQLHQFGIDHPVVVYQFYVIHACAVHAQVYIDILGRITAELPPVNGLSRCIGHYYRLQVCWY